MLDNFKNLYIKKTIFLNLVLRLYSVHVDYNNDMINIKKIL